MLLLGLGGQRATYRVTTFVNLPTTAGQPGATVGGGGRVLQVVGHIGRSPCVGEPFRPAGTQSPSAARADLWLTAVLRQRGISGLDPLSRGTCDPRWFFETTTNDNLRTTFRPQGRQRPQLPKLNVVGSIPITRSSFFPPEVGEALATRSCPGACVGRSWPTSSSTEAEPLARFLRTYFSHTR